jgi:hypothetical protein
MTVFLYVNTSKQVGDPEHIKVFPPTDAAEAWFAIPKAWSSSMRFWNRWMRPPSVKPQLRNERDWHLFPKGQ